MTYIRELLGQIGLEPERIKMFNMSAAMAAQFVEAAGEMNDQVTELGPSPLRPPTGTSS